MCVWRGVGVLIDLYKGQKKENPEDIFKNNKTKHANPHENPRSTAAHAAPRTAAQRLGLPPRWKMERVDSHATLETPRGISPLSWELSLFYKG